MGRAVLGCVASLSSWLASVNVAWRQPRMPTLLLPLGKGVVLGRSRDCGCVLGDRTISRRHALIRRSEGTWRLRDLGSMNGTYVNGCRILGDVEVRPGDEITLGDATYRLASTPARRSSPDAGRRPAALSVRL